MMADRPLEAIRTSVCIIGAGPAGLTLATRLAGMAIDVVVLEAGPSEVEESYASGAQILRSSPRDYDLEATRAAGCGGTARMWSVQTPLGGPRVRFRSLDRHDVEGRTWVTAPAWPIDYTELERWYVTARQLSGLPDGEPDPPMDDPLVRATAQRLRCATFELPSRAVFLDTLPGQLTRSPRVRVLFRHRATELNWSDGSERVTSVVARSGDGNSVIRVEAGVTVLAGGAVSNAALLLAETQAGRWGGGLSGQVGVGFMEHPHFRAGLLIPADDRLLTRPPVYEFSQRDGQVVERRYSFDPDVEGERGLLRANFKLDRVPWSRAAGDLAYGSPDSPAIMALRQLRSGDRDSRAVWSSIGSLAGLRSVARHGSARIRYAASRRRDDVFLVTAITEQLRSPRSQVLLKDDRAGDGRSARVHLRLGPDDFAAMFRSVDALGDELKVAGIGRLRPLITPDEAPPSLGWGHHHMGTTVMSARGETGVVDPDLRVHGVANLYVAGSSVFPTGGHANPTLTIVALACRLAAHLRRRGVES